MITARHLLSRGEARALVYRPAVLCLEPPCLGQELRRWMAFAASTSSIITLLKTYLLFQFRYPRHTARNRTRDRGGPACVQVATFFHRILPGFFVLLRRCIGVLERHARLIVDRFGPLFTHRYQYSFFWPYRLLHVAACFMCRVSLSRNHTKMAAQSVQRMDLGAQSCPG